MTPKAAYTCRLLLIRPENTVPHKLLFFSLQFRDITYSPVQIHYIQAGVNTLPTDEHPKQAASIHLQTSPDKPGKHPPSQNYFF